MRVVAMQEPPQTPQTPLEQTAAALALAALLLWLAGTLMQAMPRWMLE